MAKRSPILGYNHNVKYRGVIFHVQTEDSGLLSPHLFTHLFHGGVIVSTRKLVYDPGANEEAIKALMQAQHKAVMKDLKKGVFDEKIDQYLGHVEGLEPSANATVPVAKADPAELTPPPPSDAIEPPTEVATKSSAVPVETLPAGDESVPIELSVPKSRTTTAQRSSPPANKKAPTAPPPPSDAIDPQTQFDPGAAVAAAVHAAATQPIPRRAATPPPIPPQARSSPAMQIIELEMGDDDEDIDPASGRARPRDTALEIPQEAVPASRTPKSSDGIPKPLTNESSSREQSAGVRRSPTGERASLGAAALPPMKAPSRPSIAPPQRPVTASDVRARKPPEPEETDLQEAQGDDRPGAYSMGRAKPPAEQVQLREKTGRMAPIPSGLTPPSQRSGPAPRTNSPSSQPVPQAAPHHVTSAQTMPIAAKSEAHSQTGRAPNVTAPIANRPQSGVVMTRPAVIVGAPPKPVAPAPTTGRVRKAREDEGRGFGQGLISEKSLDEVILAYLSEDAEDK